MANKIFNYQVRAQSDSGIAAGTGSFTVNDVSNYRTFSSVLSTALGSEDRFAYKLTATGNSVYWEYGVGYISLIGGQQIFNREIVYSSSSSNDQLVSFPGSIGNLVVELVQNNPNFVNSERINSNSTLNNTTSTYFVDAATNLTLNLPEITGESAVIGVTITSLSGVESERSNAVTLNPNGANTINSTTSYTISKKNDYIRLISDTANNNWIVLDPISDTAASAGSDGAIQIANSNVLSSNSNLNFIDSTLFVGGSGTTDASVQITSASGAIFNAQSGSMDFAVHTTGSANTLFVDGSTNNVGLKTNLPADILDIHTTGAKGLTVTTTGSNGVPSITLKNIYSSFIEGDDIGHINFIGIDNAAANNTYARILAEASDITASSEDGVLLLQVSNNGILQNVAKIAYEDIEIGPNNSTTGGIVIGSSNTNKGDNVLIGFFSTNCGTSSVSLGNSNTIHSGSFGGVVGKNHAITGSDIWVFGGSGADITGTNSVYLLSDNNNYIQLKSDQQNRACIYVDSTGTNFDIKNTRVSNTGDIHQQTFMFGNAGGILVSGISMGVEVLNPTDASEDTKFFVKVLNEGASTNVLSVDGNSVNISNITGLDNSVLVGSDLSIVGTGDNVAIVGLTNTISNNSGEISIVGYNNTLSTSGNNNISVVGVNNIIDDNYSTTVGTSNRNSGLYSAAVGYNNGIYGENDAVVGANNAVSGNNVSAVGFNNDINNNSVYAVGQGNTSNFSGVHLLGNNITATAHNTTYLNNTNVVIDGTNITLTGSNVNIDATFGGTGLDNFAQAGSNISIFTNNSNYLSSGGNVSNLVNDSNYVVSGDNISTLNNDANFLSIPTLKFSITENHLNTIYYFSGAGTQGSGVDPNPTLYLYRGFSYEFTKNSTGHPFQIYNTGIVYTSGLTNNTGIISGTVSWTVRHDTPESGLFYICNSHSAMSGDIVVVK